MQEEYTEREPDKWNDAKGTRKHPHTHNPHTEQATQERSGGRIVADQ